MLKHPARQIAPVFAVLLLTSLLAGPPALARTPSPGASARLRAAPSAAKRQVKTTRAGGPLVSVVLTTHSLRHALTRMPSLRFSSSASRLPTLHVDDHSRYQHITGFGGAMTDSSAWLIYRELSRRTRAGVMQALFGDLRLNLIRVPMGASDFSARGVPYSYDDQPAGRSDPALAGFSIAHDMAYVVPALKQMLHIDPRVDVLSTEWSPPAWMKSNDAFDNVGEQGKLIASNYQPLARYFVKFVEAYQARGIPIWAVTPENEPWSPATFPSLNLSPPLEGDFVTQNLAPSLSAAGLHPLIFGGDGVSLAYEQQLLSTPAAPLLSGVAWHCYGGEQVMGQFHALYPRVPEIMSECSPGVIPYGGAEVAISGLRNWAAGIDLWNLALDRSGGPVQAPDGACHGCKGLVTVDEASHTARLGLDFYELGQLSKFVQRGAVRVGTERWVREFAVPNGPYGVTGGLDNVAFVNPDRSHVLVAYNNSRGSTRFAVSAHRQRFTYRLPGRATVTFTWK